MTHTNADVIIVGWISSMTGQIEASIETARRLETSLAHEQKRTATLRADIESLRELLTDGAKAELAVE